MDKNLICQACKRSFHNLIALMAHIANRRVKDIAHKELRFKIREDKIKGAKIECPVCKQRFRRSIGKHFHAKTDEDHYLFIVNQKQYLTQKLQENLWICEMKNLHSPFTDNFSYKYLINLLFITLGKTKVVSYSKKLFSKKMKKILQSKSVEDRKRMMKRVRAAEWDNLTAEQRKNHPWVIAGRKSSLASTKRGSKNQKLAYELLQIQSPEFNWIYNYTLDDNWQVDIASPEKNIFIEWDGRIHRIPIYGEKNLNNRKNRDKLKNKIIVRDRQGLLIRVKDEGRKNETFVKDKVEHIQHLISLFLGNQEVIHI